MEIKMVAVATPCVEKLRQRFTSSFQDADIPVEIVPSTIGGDGQFQSQGWRDAILFKLHTVRNRIKAHWGEILIAADIDIQFFRPIRPAVEAAIRDGEMCFQSEFHPPRPYQINAGFIVMRCSERVLQVYEEVISSNIRDLPLPDQTWFVQNLPRLNINWRFLPPSFFAKSHGGWGPADMVLHHANCTVQPGSIQLKLEQMDMIRRVRA